MSLLKKTYLDPDGSLSLPEIFATAFSFLVFCGVVRDFATSPAFPYLQVAGSIGTIVFALAAAQRARDGVTKPTPPSESNAGP